MGYSHAERNLAAVRALTAETVALLRERAGLTAEQQRWVTDVSAASPGLRAAS